MTTTELIRNTGEDQVALLIARIDADAKTIQRMKAALEEIHDLAQAEVDRLREFAGANVTLQLKLQLAQADALAVLVDDYFTTWSGNRWPKERKVIAAIGAYLEARK